MERAIRALQRDIRSGLNPVLDFKRNVLEVQHGQLFFMPSQFGSFVGVKVSTVAPKNPTVGKSRIQGIYILMDSVTLSPILVLDGQALTILRTPAVSASVADLLAPSRVDHLVIFGTGVQAWGHVLAMRAIRSIGRVTVVARDQGRGAELISRIQDSGLPARLGVADDVRNAQIIVCATTSRVPLFAGSLVANNSLTVAMGTHESHAREVDSHLMARSQIVVEDPSVAREETGDVVIPLEEGSIDGASLIAIRDIITGAVTVDLDRPRVFKSSGMPWEDLVIAAEIYREL
jgi:ornithine cyclodeaminase